MFYVLDITRLACVFQNKILRHNTFVVYQVKIDIIAI